MSDADEINEKIPRGDPARWEPRRPLGPRDNPDNDGDEDREEEE